MPRYTIEDYPPGPLWCRVHRIELDLECFDLRRPLPYCARCNRHVDPEETMTEEEVGE